MTLLFFYMIPEGSNPGERGPRVSLVFPSCDKNGLGQQQAVPTIDDQVEASLLTACLHPSWASPMRLHQMSDPDRRVSQESKLKSK